MTVEEFRDSTLAGPIAQMADLFLIAGDIHAMLYTGRVPLSALFFCGHDCFRFILYFLVKGFLEMVVI